MCLTAQTEAHAHSATSRFCACMAGKIPQMMMIRLSSMHACMHSTEFGCIAGSLLVDICALIKRVSCDATWRHYREGLHQLVVSHAVFISKWVKIISVGMSPCIYPGLHLFFLRRRTRNRIFCMLRPVHLCQRVVKTPYKVPQERLVVHKKSCDNQSATETSSGF
jgi:hypothetical protein